MEYDPDEVKEYLKRAAAEIADEMQALEDAKIVTKETLDHDLIEGDVVEYDLKKTLEWCEANEVSFKIVVEGGLLAVTGRRRNISATYPIGEPVGPTAVGQAIYAALYSVERGSKFHAEFGDFPPVGGTVSETEAGNGEGSDILPPAETTPPPGLLIDPEQ